MGGSRLWDRNGKQDFNKVLSEHKFLVMCALKTTTRRLRIEFNIGNKVKQPFKFKLIIEANKSWCVTFISIKNNSFFFLLELKDCMPKCMKIFCVFFTLKEFHMFMNYLNLWWTMYIQSWNNARSRDPGLCFLADFYKSSHNLH